MNGRICLWLLGAMLILGCDDNPVEPIDGFPEGQAVAAERDLGTANSEFGLELMKEVLSSADPGENVMISPLSVQAALLMTLNGANGTTYKEMTAALRTQDFSEVSLNKAYRDLAESLNAADQKIQISLANGVFYDELRIAPDEGFSARLEQSYNAEMAAMQFSAPSSLDAINNWVRDHTEGKIESILDEITPEEVMFLINALYFKGDWSNPFPLGATTDRPFHLSDGSTTTVAMMDHDAPFSFFQGPDLEAVDLHFGDSAFAMTCLLPTDPQESVDDLINNLTTDRLEELYSNDLQTGRVQIKLPRFEIEYKRDLNDALKALGMSRAFSSSGADFSRLGTALEGNLFLTKVAHKTYLKVDEKGAEGAAVTSVGVGVTSLPPVINFDRPFAIVLRDVHHGSLLFIGKVEVPNQE